MAGSSLCRKTEIGLSNGAIVVIALLLFLLAERAIASANTTTATSARAKIGTKIPLLLLLFREGQPIRGVTVAIDGNPFAITSRFGSAKLFLSPGEHEIVLSDGGKRLTRLHVMAEAGANMQMIVTLYPDGRPPLVDIESSADRMIGEMVSDHDTHTPVLLETGVIGGRVVSMETGEPVADARIFASGTDRVTQSDKEGRFELDLPIGTYSLSVIHPQFSTATQNNIQVSDGALTSHNVELTPAGVELQEFVVVAPYIEGSVASVVSRQRESFSVSEVLGAEQMASAGDGDAAEALRRVTGLTIENGENILIRGMPTRYTKTLWNGSELPSPDPNTRVVPLDLFPTGVLEAVEVKKTYSPDLPGSFGGGLMQLETRGIPDETFMNIALKLGYNSEATFSNGQVYRGGSLDFFGIDDGTRDLPGVVADAVGSGRNLAPISISNPDGFTDEDLERLGEAFPNIYQARDATLGPDMGLSMTGGSRGQLGPGDLGVLSSFVYSNEWAREGGPDNTFGVSGDDLVPRDQFIDDDTENEVTLGGMLTISYETPQNHNLTSNTFLTRQTTDFVRVREGIRAENDQTLEETTLEWIEAQLLTQQLLGTHAFPGLHGLTLDWRGMFSQADRTSPDRRFYRYLLERDQFVFDESSLNRRYADLTDEIFSLDTDMSLPLGDENRIFTLLKAGGHLSNQDRDSEINIFQFEFEDGSIPTDISTRPNPEDIFNTENINADGFVIDDLTGANDDYRGTQDIHALYMMADARFYNTFRISGGVRSEQAKLNVRTFQASAGGNENEVESSLDTSDLLPAVTATWFMTDDMQLRVGYGKTLSRPDLKELSAASYIDPDTDDVFVGNPNLKQTIIDNVDARWEWYPSGTERLTLGAFWKTFTDPIETVKIPGFEAPRSFQNADTATDLGIELSFRASMGRLKQTWEDFYIEGNTALIDSEVKLAENTIFTNTNTTRPLQGQAPYVINLITGYDGPSIDAAILYNIVGERIAEVGVQGQPDIIEQPAPKLDFVFRYKLSDALTAMFSAENLLNPAIEFLQDREVQESYNEGVEVSFGVKWEL